jgi:hypothetical protein
MWNWFMKPSDAAIHAKLDELKRLVIAFQAQTNERFDSVDKKLALILDKVSSGGGNVSPELEQAIKSVSAAAVRIDQQVPDAG